MVALLRARALVSGSGALASSSRATMAITGADAAHAVGYVIGAGSLTLYTPMIYRICRSQSAAGLAPTTWVLKLASYATTDAYNFSRHYPLSQYAESLTLALQAAVMLGLICYFTREAKPLLIAASIAALELLALSSADGRELALPVAQAVASFAGATAVLPQLVINLRRGAVGEFSPLTATLLAGGNALRFWTTLELADGDLLLLAGCACGFLVNSALLAQILYFALVRERMSVFDLYASDFVGKRAATTPAQSAVPGSAAASQAAGDSTERGNIGAVAREIDVASKEL